MRLFPAFLVIALISVSSGQVLAAQDCNRVTRETTADIIAADALLARPVGIVATAVGSVLYAISLPFTLAAGGEEAVRERLVEDPARFTFNRCLGDFRYRRYGPDDPGEEARR